VAVPRLSQRPAFRPQRTVSWPTRIFAGLVFLVAIGTVGAFLVVVLPARVSALAQSEAVELAAARTGTSTSSDTLKKLWNDMGPVGALTLSSDQVTQELAQAKAADKATGEAAAHLISAKALLAEASAVPFQTKKPPFVTTDQPFLQHLDKGLQTASKLSNAANLQLNLAQHAQSDSSTLDQLNASLRAQNWSQSTKIAADLQRALNSDQRAASNPEALLDPLWAKWLDAMATYASTAQQYALAQASGQTASAQQLGRGLAAAGDRLAAARDAAQKNAGAWQQSTVTPLLDAMAGELAATG
jgi:hypothetical protein